jgi:hypothetical protein
MFRVEHGAKLSVGAKKDIVASLHILHALHATNTGGVCNDATKSLAREIVSAQRKPVPDIGKINGEPGPKARRHWAIQHQDEIDRSTN